MGDETEQDPESMLKIGWGGEHIFISFQIPTENKKIAEESVYGSEGGKSPSSPVGKSHSG